MKPFKGDRPEIPSEPTVAEVYEWFGATSYSAQVLEQGILMTLVVLDSKGNITTPEQWDAFYERYDRKTLGQMLRKLSTKHDFPDGFEELLDSALKERNRLAHHFFADHSEDFIFPEGRFKMIKDLESMMDLFFRADAAVETLFKFQRHQLGMTEEVVEKLMDKMLEEYQANKAPQTTSASARV